MKTLFWVAIITFITVFVSQISFANAFFGRGFGGGFGRGFGGGFGRGFGGRSHFGGGFFRGHRGGFSGNTGGVTRPELVRSEEVFLINYLFHFTVKEIIQF